jgi:hypothetical protein
MAFCDTVSNLSKVSPSKTDCDQTSFILMKVCVSARFGLDSAPQREQATAAHAATVINGVGMLFRKFIVTFLANPQMGRVHQVHFVEFTIGLPTRIWQKSALPCSAIKGPANRDEIVGTWGTDSAGGGFLYRDGQRTDVSELRPPGSGWSILTAEHINDSGQIIGVGGYGGVSKFYVLTPAEPKEQRRGGSASFAP